MNITFLLKSFDMGGVEIVTTILANQFHKDGHNISIWSFYQGDGIVLNRYEKGITTDSGIGFKCNNQNISKLHNYLKKNNTEVVINQWGLHWIPIKTIQKAKKGLSIKVISVYHNDPLKNGILQHIDNQILNTHNLFQKQFLKFKRFVFRCVTGYAMRYVYNHSDLYCILSPSFIDNFRKFTGITHTNKLVVQTNPITIDNEGFVYNLNDKKNEIIYVGRLDKTQKCVHRIIEAWANIENEYSDWCLKIVGNGEDMERLDNLAKELRLSHISFEGMQKPRPYYEKAQMLLLTSDFEGFGLVIIEGMRFGVVPIVYGSYSAVYDIIESGKDGIITPYPYNINDTILSLRNLITDTKLRQRMAIEAIKKSEKFSLELICEQWYKLFKQK